MPSPPLSYPDLRPWYSERLEKLKLPSLEYRRKRADVIQTYKIMNNIDRIDGKKFFKPGKEVWTRGHSKRVEKTQCKSLVRHNTFSQRMANDWNALPDAVVMSGSINQFKGRLGRWWKNDPILYGFFYQNIRSPRVTKHSAIAIYNAREGHQPCLSPSMVSQWRVCSSSDCHCLQSVSDTQHVEGETTPYC